MTEEVSILAVPGLASQSAEFLAALAELAVRNGWDPNGIAGVISHESRFNPAARSSTSTATGLIQFIEATARKLGTTTAELARMTAVQQLRYVEAFFDRFMPRTPTEPEDYILVTYGRPDAIGEPDSFVLDRRDSDSAGERARYKANAALDPEGTGAITAGSLRRSMAHVLSAAHGRFLRTVPRAPDVGGGSGGAGGALLVAALVFGPEIIRHLREVVR